MANPEKGEAEIVLDQERYTIRFDNNATIEVEDEIGLGISEITQHLKEGKVSLKFMRALIWAGLKGGGNPLPIEEVGRKMPPAQSEKIQDLMMDCLEAWSMSMVEDKEAKKEMKNRMQKMKDKQRPTKEG